MKTLFLRIYLTVVAVLALFAVGSGWLMQRHLDQERQRAEVFIADRMAAWGELLQRSLPTADAPAAEQAAALQDWSMRLRLPMALDDAQGRRIAVSDAFTRRRSDPNLAARTHSIPLSDGRTLWVMRPGIARMTSGGFNGGPPPEPRGGPPGDRPDGPRMPPPRQPMVSPFTLHFLAPGWAPGAGMVIVLALLFVAVAAGAWPVTRRLTRRLESLKRGVEQFGAGALDHRVDTSGRDEVAAVATSFNQAAERVQALVQSHRSLLANASHEFRSPLARLKMAVSLLENAENLPAQAKAEQRQQLQKEIDTNIAELDALVEEVLLASRLDAQQRVDRHDPVDLMTLLIEEGARVGAAVQGDEQGGRFVADGDERLLRRALRNLLENARRYGGGDVEAALRRAGGMIEARVSDRGPGVPEAMRERIFEPFFRLPGHAEQAGGVGLGLSLVKQIALQHGGRVHCEGREGGGSCFVIELPAGAV